MAVNVLRNAATSSGVGRSNQPTLKDKGTTFLQNVKMLNYVQHSLSSQGPAISDGSVAFPL